MFKSGFKSTNKKNLSSTGDASEQDTEGVFSQEKATLGLTQIQLMADRSAQQSKSARQQNEQNQTGIPDALKYGVENLSGQSLNEVKVTYNSPKPALLQAKAFAQGKEIHIGSGHEKTLPHEAWHIAQQKQGRVKSTTQWKGSTNINDDQSLEKEADLMGSKAQSLGFSASPSALSSSKITSAMPAQLEKIDYEKLKQKGREEYLLKTAATPAPGSRSQEDSGFTFPENERPDKTVKELGQFWTRNPLINRPPAAAPTPVAPAATVVQDQVPDAAETEVPASDAQEVTNNVLDGVSTDTAGGSDSTSAEVTTPVPDPTATPVPTAVPPTATPVPDPTATPVPNPTATPVPNPTATPVPDPTATPVPDPTATPVPDPTASVPPPGLSMERTARIVQATERLKKGKNKTRAVENSLGFANAADAPLSDLAADGKFDNIRNLFNLRKPRPKKQDSNADHSGQTSQEATLRSVGGGAASAFSSVLNLNQTYRDLNFAYSRDKRERQNADGTYSKSKIGSTLSRGLVNATKLGASGTSNLKEVLRLAHAGKSVVDQTSGALAGFQTATGAMDLGMGGYESYKAGKRLKGIDAIHARHQSEQSAGVQDSTMATPEQLALMKYHQKTMQSRGRFKAVTGALDAAAGISTLSGAAPLAMTFGGLSASLKTGKYIRKSAKEYGRKRTSQRMRSKDQIADDSRAKYENFGKSAMDHTAKKEALKAVSAAGAGPGIRGKMSYWLGTPLRKAQIMYHSHYAKSNEKSKKAYAEKVGAGSDGVLSDDHFNSYADKKIKNYSDTKGIANRAKNFVFGTRSSEAIDAATPAKLSKTGFGFNANKTTEKKKANTKELASFLLNSPEYRAQMIGKDSKYYNEINDEAKLEIIMEKLTGKQHHNRKKYKEDNP